MNFNYMNLLREQLYGLQNTLGISNYEFEIEYEQDFIKRKDLKPNTIYVLVKMLQNDLQIGVETQPLQIFILAEQNSLDVSRAFFGEFAKTYNFKTHSERYGEEGNYKYLWVKQQYSEPVVLSNFNVVDYGYRSILYISANLYITDDVVDLHDLTIDSNEVKVLTWDLAYNMTPNTQQTMGSTEFISKSVKSVSSLAITITIPVVQSALTSKVLAIMNETDTASADSGLLYGGNEDFEFDFYLGDIEFESKKMKLIMCEFGTAIDNIPVIRLGFMK